jgi:hypothetical protein
MTIGVAGLYEVSLQKDEMGLMVRNVRARLFEKRAFPMCPVFSTSGYYLS